MGLVSSSSLINRRRLHPPLSQPPPVIEKVQRCRHKTDSIIPFITQGHRNNSKRTFIVFGPEKNTFWSHLLANDAAVLDFEDYVSSTFETQNGHKYVMFHTDNADCTTECLNNEFSCVVPDKTCQEWVLVVMYSDKGLPPVDKRNDSLFKNAPGNSKLHIIALVYDFDLPDSRFQRYKQVIYQHFKYGIDLEIHLLTLSNNTIDQPFY